jgi:hypothetical protein
MPGIEAIITGIDLGGPHIYVSDGIEIRCSDSSGFAAVGSGAWHASSQFMLARHGFNSPMPETLLRRICKKWVMVSWKVVWKMDTTNAMYPQGVYY